MSHQANKENIQDETGSNDEKEVESEGKFEDGDNQSLVGTEDELDLEGVFDEVPGNFK